jgi:hypothetical protein
MSHALDQIEVYGKFEYSGSYTDRVFTREATIQTSSSRRYHLGGLASLKTSVMNELTTDLFDEITRRWRGTTAYRDVKNRILFQSLEYKMTQQFGGSGGQLVANLGYAMAGPTQNMFAKAFADNELITDSILPKPSDIMVFNGAKPLDGLTNEFEKSSNTGTSGSKVYGIPVNPKKFKFVIGSPGVELVASDAENISDNLWGYSFPFEIKYSAIPKSTNPGFNTRYLVEYSGTFGTSSRDQVWPGATVPHTNAFTSSLYTITWLVNNNNPDDNSSKINFVTLADTLEKTTEFPEDTLYQIPPSNYTNHYPRSTKINTAFYSFYKQSPFYYHPRGNIWEYASYNGVAYPIKNIHKFPMPILLREHASESTPIYHQRSVYSSDLGFYISGWKYGAYHAVPQKTQCVFRRNRFGQVRDMLEQRPLMKNFNFKKRVMDLSPINVVFTSGTLAYVTYSNPSLNYRDSGIYDYECKSGRPFFDD